MQSLLHANMAQYIVKPLAHQLLYSTTCQAPVPNIYIDSKSHVVTWAYINTLVCRLVNLPISNLFACLQNDVERDFLYNNYMFVINVNSDSIKVIKSLVEQKCLITERHIVIINVTDKLRGHLALALSSVINKYTNTTLFILVNISKQYIPRSICNLLLNIDLAFDIARFKKDAKVDPDMYVPSDDPMNLCIMMSTCTIPRQTHLETYVHRALNELVTNRCKPVYLNGVRELAVRIGAGIVPIRMLSQIILRWRADAETVAILAELDSCARQSSKEIFAFEHFIQKLTM